MMKAVFVASVILINLQASGQENTVTSKHREFEPCFKELLAHDSMQKYVAPYERFLRVYPPENYHEIAVSILYSIFDTLREHNLNVEADCFINQISKIYETYNNIDALLRILSISGHHSLFYVRDDIQAKKKFEYALNLCNERSRQDSVCEAISKSLNVLYEKLDLQSLKSYQPGEELDYAIFLLHHAKYHDALKALDSIPCEELPADDYDQYLFIQIVTRAFLGVDASKYTEQIYDLQKSRKEKSFWIEGSLGLIKWLDGDIESAVLHLDMSFQICLDDESYGSNNISKLEISTPCEIFNAMKAMALGLVQDNSTARNTLKDFIYDENIPESNRIAAAINLGDYYLGIGVLDSSIYFLNLAEQLLKSNRIKTQGDVDNIYYLKAKIEEFNGNLEGALAYWILKAKLKESNKTRMRLAQDYIKIAELYTATLQFDSAQIAIDRVEFVVDAYSIEEKVQWLRCKTKILFERGEYNATIKLIESNFAEVHNYNSSSRVYKKGLFNLQTHLLEAYVVAGEWLKARDLFNYFRKESLFEHAQILSDYDYSFIYGLGYIIACNYQTDFDTAELKSLFYVHTKNKTYALYREPFILVSILGPDSDLFYSEYMNELVKGIAWTEGNGYISEYQKEYADRLFSIFIHSKQQLKVLLEDNIANYFLTSKSRRIHEKKWLQSIANLCDRMSLREFSPYERNVSLAQLFKQYALSTYSYPSQTLPGKLVPGEVLIKIFHSTIGREDVYTAGVLNNQVLTLVDLGALDEKRIIDEYGVYLNSGNTQSNEWIYKQLWSQIEPLVSEATKITLIPDGLYYFINLNTLKSLDGVYLLDRFHYITYLYGVQGLTKLNVSLSNEGILLFGDPSFGSANTNGAFLASKELSKRSHSELTSWIELPETRAEVLEVQSQLGDHGCSVILGSDANETFWRGVKHPKILHLATHGFTSTASENELSGFVLSNANDPNDDLTADGYIYSSEIAQMDFSLTELVTLSMCESGIGAISSTGISSLSNAFIEAGAENVLYSVAKVSDKAARDFMRRFYTYYRNTASPIYSITNSTREMRLLYEKPVYWGAFVLITTYK